MPPSNACRSCAISKVKCTRTGSETCARCIRLGQECAGRQTRRRFNGFKKDMRINALESRVNELLTSTGQPDVDIDVVGRGFLTMEQAEGFFETFITTMTSQFPFIGIPSQMTAMQMRLQKPFLFLSILSSASFSDVPLQQRLGREVKAAIASQMIIHGKVSFDLLQGLLVNLAWSHFHPRPYRYTQFLQLAVALLSELRLDRPPQTKAWKTVLKFNESYSEEGTYARPWLGSDEQRAVVGCYYLSSTISSLLQKQPLFPPIPYLEECCSSLRDKAEYPWDKVIFSAMQLQQIAEKVDRISTRHSETFYSSSSTMELYVSGIKNDLKTFENQSKDILIDSPLLALQFHTAELSLYQLSLKQPSSQPASDEMFLACRSAAQSIFSLYLSLPPGLERVWTNTQWVQVGFALIVACRLATTRGRIADKEELLITLTKMKERVEGLVTTGVEDIFANYAKRVTKLEKWVSSSIGRQEARVNEPHPQPQTLVFEEEATEADTEDTLLIEDQSGIDSALDEPEPVDWMSSMPGEEQSMNVGHEMLDFEQILAGWL